MLDVRNFIFVIIFFCFFGGRCVSVDVLFVLVCRLLRFVRCLWFVACCLWFAVRCLLFVVRCSLLVVRCALMFVSCRWLLFVVVSLVFAVELC